MTTIQHRRGTGAQWTAATEPLAAGELGYETDGDKSLKVGDGAALYDALPERLLPSGGTDGQVLTKGAGTAVAWEDLPAAQDFSALVATLPVVMTWDGTTYQEPSGLAGLGLGAADFHIRIWIGPVPPVEATGGEAGLWQQGDLYLDTVVS